MDLFFRKIEDQMRKDGLLKRSVADSVATRSRTIYDLDSDAKALVGGAVSVAFLFAVGVLGRKIFAKPDAPKVAANAKAPAPET